jgi:hypothetical protein
MSDVLMSNDNEINIECLKNLYLDPFDSTAYCVAIFFLQNFKSALLSKRVFGSISNKLRGKLPKWVFLKHIRSCVVTLPIKLCTICAIPHGTVTTA